MSAGTLTLTNNSDAVVGAGTAFLTDLAAGDFIVANVGGIAYTLPVKAVTSDTALTIISKFTGPTTNGLAWHIATREQQALLTAATVVQNVEALRGLNYDKQNWQAVFSSDVDITVTLPDGSQFNGPSWKKLATIVGNLDTTALASLERQGPYTILNSPDKSRRLVLPNSSNGEMVYQNAQGVNIGIAIGAGGTGAVSAPGARANLELDRVDQQFATETRLWNDAAKNNCRLTVQTDGTWGVYSEVSGNWVPLKTYQGGTGVRTYEELSIALGMKWLPSTDPWVLEHIDWLGLGMSPTETMVRIGPRTIEIQGIIRSTSTVVFRLKKGPSGLPNFRMPYSPAMYADPNGNMGICYLRSVAGAASNFDFVADGTQTGIAWYMVNCTIRFIAAGEN